MANKKNFGTSTVLTAPSPATSGTSLVVQSGHGARFPAAPFYCTVHPDNTLPTLDNAEVVYVTAKSTDTFTIVRSQKETTSPISIAVGMRISNTVFTEDVDNVSLIQNEVPGGSINGSNTVFTTASVFGTGRLRVYKNGIRLKGGGADYTEAANLQGFTMVTAPATSTVLLVDYEVGNGANTVGTNSLISDEAVTGSVNSSNTVFTTARAYIGGSLEVYINGLKQYRTTDYVETTPGSGVFTFNVAPLTGDVIRVNYHYNLNPSSNADTVDGIHASSTATANMLMPLDANARIPLNTMPVSFKVVNRTTNYTQTSATPGQVISGGLPFTVPTLGADDWIRVRGYAGGAYNNGTGISSVATLWEGTVGSGTSLQRALIPSAVSGAATGMSIEAIYQPSSGSKTFNLGVASNGSATVTLEGASTYPIYLTVEVLRGA